MTWSTTVAAQAPDPLLGCFALAPGGEPVIRIDAAAGAVTGSIREARRWSPPLPLRAATARELASLLARDAHAVLASRVGHDAPFGVFLVEPGAEIAGEEVVSSTLAFLRYALVDVFAVRCPPATGGSPARSD